MSSLAGVGRNGFDHAKQTTGAASITMEDEERAGHMAEVIRAAIVYHVCWWDRQQSSFKMNVISTVNCLWHVCTYCTHRHGEWGMKTTRNMPSKVTRDTSYHNSNSIIQGVLLVKKICLCSEADRRIRHIDTRNRPKMAIFVFRGVESLCRPSTPFQIFVCVSTFVSR